MLINDIIKISYRATNSVTPVTLMILCKARVQKRPDHLLRPFNARGAIHTLISVVAFVHKVNRVLIILLDLDTMLHSHLKNRVFRAILHSDPLTMPVKLAASSRGSFNNLELFNHSFPIQLIRGADPDSRELDILTNRKSNRVNSLACVPPFKRSRYMSPSNHPFRRVSKRNSYT